MESNPLPVGGSNGRVAGLLAAAGAGERLGRGPKAFLELGSRTLLERAYAALALLVDEVVIAVPAGSYDRARRLVPGARLVTGGSTRQETVASLLRDTTAEFVLVHDVARPFLPKEVGERVLEAARRTGAASASLAVADTLTDAVDGATVPRERLRSLQTPQGFRRDVLQRAHRTAAEAKHSATDDTGLVRALGLPVELVAGSPWLFKLTGPADLRFLEALARCWDDD